MEKINLPFEINVEMKTYLFAAFSLGMVKACMPNYEVWLCNRLINCNCYNNRRCYWNTEGEDLWSTDDGGFSHQLIKLAPATFENIGEDLIRFNKEMLRNGHYISGQYNEFYIPGTTVYSKRDFYHRYILFGFDDEQQVFKSATYLSDDFYRPFDLKYNDYLKAVTYSKVKLVPINYYRINPDYEASIDIDLIQRDLEDYISSRNSVKSLPVMIYGASVWESLANYVANLCSPNLDLRFIRSFMEHKIIMQKRMRTLTELSYISNCNLASSYEEKVSIPAQRIFNLAIKHNLTHDSKLLVSIAEAIRRVNDLEEKLLIHMLNNIRNVAQNAI